MKGKTTILSMILIFMILNVLDLALTVSAVENGKGVEGNPVMAYLLENSSVAFTAVKIVAGFAIAFLLFKLSTKNKKAARITAMLIVAAYVLVALNNAVVNAEEITYSKTVTGTIYGGVYSYNKTGSSSGLASYDNYEKIGYLLWNYDKLPIIQNMYFYVYGADIRINFNNGTRASIGVGQTYQVSATLSGDPNKRITIAVTRFSDKYLIYVEAIDEITGSGNVLHTISYDNWYFEYRYGSGSYISKTFYSVAVSDFGVGYNNGGILYIKGMSSGLKIEVWANGRSKSVTNYFEYRYSNGVSEINITKNGQETKWEITYYNLQTQQIDTWTEAGLSDIDLNGIVLNGYVLSARMYYPAIGGLDYVQLTDIPRPSTTTTTTSVKFYFLDAETGSLLDNVNFTLQESFIGNSEVINGTYDYSVTVNNLNDLEVYTYTASRTGYEVATGNVYYPPAGKETTVYVYLTPIKTPSSSNNSIITFRVVSDFAGYQIAVVDAAVILNGQTKLTNAQGYVSFEVPKNQTYSYLVSKDGYFSKAGEITATQDYHSVVVQLEAITPATTPTPTATATPTPSTGTGGTTTIGGGGRGSLDNGINLLYQNAEGLIGMAILVTFVSLVKMMGRR
ncbi:DUF5658 family protein [Geoglobus acetivorans]|uniref:DUF5658 domain-containing protein n=1 Tax=Geoglobus acetivorans TaxID=565033 RepID=A0A0A7GGB3_GEOAI|nr:hypothetical protein GACE_2096 [Geoglobus acetivorans]